VGKGSQAIALRQVEGTKDVFGGDWAAAEQPRALPVGVRLAVIVISGLVGWAIILGPLYLLW
jgi:hypothetical protein